MEVKEGGGGGAALIQATLFAFRGPGTGPFDYL